MTTLAAYAYHDDTEQLDYVSVPPLQSHRMTVTPADVQQPKPTIQGILDQSTARTVAGVSAVIEKHVEKTPAHRSAWKCAETYAVFGLLALTGFALVGPRRADPEPASVLAGASSAAVLSFSRDRRKLKTVESGKAAPKNYAAIKFGGGNVESKS